MEFTSFVVLHPFRLYLRTLTPRPSSFINLNSLHVCDGCSARERGFDLNLQPPLDMPLPKYNTQLWGCVTSVITEREENHLDSRADGQRVTRTAISSRVRFLDECKQPTPERGQHGTPCPLRATPGTCPPSLPPFQRLKGFSSRHSLLVYLPSYHSFCSSSC